MIQPLGSGFPYVLRVYVRCEELFVGCGKFGVLLLNMFRHYVCTRATKCILYLHTVCSFNPSFNTILYDNLKSTQSKKQNRELKVVACCM
jgi:hypothetical protein